MPHTHYISSSDTTGSGERVELLLDSDYTDDHIHAALDWEKRRAAETDIGSRLNVCCATLYGGTEPVAVHTAMQKCSSVILCSPITPSIPTLRPTLHRIVHIMSCSLQPPNCYSPLQTAGRRTGCAGFVDDASWPIGASTFELTIQHSDIHNRKRKHTWNDGLSEPRSEVRVSVAMPCSLSFGVAHESDITAIARAI